MSHETLLMDALRAALWLHGHYDPVESVCLVTRSRGGRRFRVEVPLFPPAIPPGDPSPAYVPHSRERRHGPDYLWCLWDGKPHNFSPTQAACVKVLWEAMEQGCPEVGQQAVLTKADSARTRLDHVFRDRNGKVHEAWGTMIVPVGGGVYRLQSPQNEPWHDANDTLQSPHIALDAPAPKEISNAEP